MHPEDEAFIFFLHDLVCGDYAQSYEVGWDDCMSELGRHKHNPFSNRAYPLEHKAWNQGFQDGLVLLTEFEKHWRGNKPV